MTTLPMKGNLTNGRITFSQTELDSSFNHFTDIMERCLCPFVLLGETARSIIENEKLQGDGIYTGVRVAEFTSTTYSMLKTLASNIDLHLGIENFEKDNTGFSWNFQGVPIKVKLIQREYNFINNADFVWYYSENYRVPNPFSTYWKERSLIK